MSYVRVNGVEVYEAEVTIPRVGAWHARFTVGPQVGVVPGPVVVSIADGALQFQGFASRLGNFADYVRMRVEPGRGTLRTASFAGKSYRNVPLSVPLNDLMSASGESLSAQSEPSVLQSFLPAWTTAQQPRGLGAALLSLLRAIPPDPSGRQLAWRSWTLPVSPQGAIARGAVPVFDGAVWVGYEAWPDSPQKENVDYVYEHEDAAAGRMTIAPTELPTLSPGVVFRGRRISAVRHEFTSDTLARTHAFYES